MVNERESHALILRVERLERQNRQWRMVVMLGAVGFVAVGLLGQAGQKARTVEAEEFVLRDARGSVRARLSASAAGVSLGLYHEAGSASIAVSAVPSEGVNINLTGTDKKIKAMLLAQSEGIGLYLSPGDATGPPMSPRAVVEVGKDGSGVVGLSDRTGRTRAAIGVRADGSPLTITR